jgi:hypothetical protein
MQPTQPQTIGGVLDTSFQLYKASVVKVWPLCLLLAIGGSVPSIYLISKGVAGTTDPFATLAAMQDSGYWLSNLVSLTISLVAMGALYLRMNAISTGADVGLGAALQGSLERFLILFLSMVLFIIALFVGFLLLIVPGLILMISLMLSFNLVLLERKGPVDALVSSHKLVWGNWWRTLIILTVGFLLVFVIYLAVGMAVGLVMPLLLLGSGDAFLYATLTVVAVSGIASLIVTPFYIALVLATYWDLKLRKEGGDLAARIGALGAAGA